MGENWASHLPHPGAGRPKDAKNGVLRPGIKGGTSHPKRSAAVKRDDPLHIPGSPTVQKPPHWADIDKIAEGARLVHLALHEARRREKIDKIIDRLLDDAADGNYRAAELTLAYFAGKPVAYVARSSANVALNGDEVAAMAAQVSEQMKADGMRVIARETAAPAEPEQEPEPEATEDIA